MFLKICHLYPQQMSLYGDRGNIITLKYRAEQRNIKIEIQSCLIGEKIEQNTNFIMLGGGQDADQEKILKDLHSRKLEIQDFILNGAVFLGICGGYQLLGAYYETVNQKLEGLNLLNFFTERAKKNEKRIIGNVIAYNENFGELYGFENHGGRTFLQNNNLQALGKIISGGGNNASDLTEGVYSEQGAGLIIGTYLHSFLPKNYKVADHIITKALKINDLDLKEIDNNLEIKNRNFLKLKIK